MKVQSALDSSEYQRSEKGIAERVKGITVSAIKEMALLAMKEKNAISLSWGLPSFETPKHIREATKEALDTQGNIGKYTQPPFGLKELRDLIADDFKKRFNREVDPDKQIIVHAGAMQGVYCAIHTLVNPGDEVIMTDPGFSSHREQIKLAGGKIVWWTLNEDGNWALDVEKLEDLITQKTKLLIIVNPANPTGSVFTEESLRRVAGIAKKHDIFIISDEPYDFLVFNGNKHFSIAQIEEFRENVIYIGSLSKKYAMTGWRIGYSVAEEGIINQIMKIHDATVICAPTICQYGAIAALKGSQDCVRDFHDEFKERREILYKRLEKVNKIFSFKKTDGAYYVFPRIEAEHKDSYEFAIRLLKEAKVVTVPGAAFGPSGEHHVRMTFCGSREDINEAFDRLEKWQEENC